MQTDQTNKRDNEPALSAVSELGGAPGYVNGERLRAEIEAAINRCSAENGSNTPDFILATFLTSCLEAFDAAVVVRENYYRPLIREGIPSADADTGDSHTDGAMQPT